jgi:hypothetical protein
MLILLFLICGFIDAYKINPNDQCSLNYKELPLENFYPLDTTSAVLTNDAKYLFQVNKGGDISVWNLNSYEIEKYFHRNKFIGETYQRLTVWDNYIVADSIWGSESNTIMTIIDLYTFDIIKLDAQTINKYYSWIYSCHTIYRNKIIYVSKINYANTSSIIYSYDLIEKKGEYLFTSDYLIQDITVHDNMLVMKESSNGAIMFYTIYGAMVFSLNSTDDTSDIFWTPVKTLQFTLNSRYLVTHCTTYALIQIWDLYQNIVIYEGSWYPNGIYSSIIIPLDNGIIYSNMNSEIIFWDKYNVTKINGQACSYAFNNDKLLLGYNSLTVLDYHNKQILCKRNTTEIITQIVPKNNETFITLSDRPLIWFY